MNEPTLPLDQILQGDCVEVMQSLPPESVDVVFADPPYNLQLRQELRRPNQTMVDRVDDHWDQFESFAEYDAFTRAWLEACRRVLKHSGTLWVIGSYHNIFRVGAILQDLGYWILNEVLWIKQNPMPNFRGVRFTNSHETLIWVQKERGAPYTFNHHAMKNLNEGLQMRSDWTLPLCTGKERLKVNGAKVHSTQKPEALLYRVLMASSNPGDVLLDPFFGTGTSGVIAKRLNRHWVGIERDPVYVDAARQRIDNTLSGDPDPEVFKTNNPRREARLPLGMLLESGLLLPGQMLYFGPEGDETARILADGTLDYHGRRGSIHQIANLIQPATSNGWQVWYFIDAASGQRRSIDSLRQHLRSLLQPKGPSENS